MKKQIRYSNQSLFREVFLLTDAHNRLHIASVLGILQKSGHNNPFHTHNGCRPCQIHFPEQTLLRKEFVADVKKNLTAQLNNIDIQNEDGTIENLGEKYGNKPKKLS